MTYLHLMKIELRRGNIITDSRHIMILKQAKYKENHI